MKQKGFYRAGWLAAGLALGGAGGFWAGRHQPETGMEGPGNQPMGMAAMQVLPGGPVEKGRKEGASPAGGSPFVVSPEDSSQRRLRRILDIKDTMARMAALKTWLGSLPFEQVLEVVKELEEISEEEGQMGEIESRSLAYQALDVITDLMFGQGAESMMAALLAREKPDEEDEMRDGLAGEVFRKWAQSDLPAARAMLEKRLAGSSEIGDLDSNLSIHLMRAWVKTEPEAAVAWLLRQQEDLVDEAMSPALLTLAYLDLDKARHLLETQAGIPDRDDIAGEIAGVWASTAPEKALAWAEGLPDGLIGPAAKATMEIWMEKDLTGAKQAFDRMGGLARDAALPIFVQNWEKQEWPAAAAFLESQSAGEGKTEAMSDLMYRWAGDDEQAASAWLSKQPAGPERDAGVEALVGQIRGSDPEAAAVWGASMGEGPQRMETLRVTFRHWYRTALPEALRWVESAPNLADAERAQLIKMAPRR